MYVVSKVSVEILVVGDCELIQLTLPGLRERDGATRDVMRFSEWDLLDGSYSSAANTGVNTLTPLRTR